MEKARYGKLLAQLPETLKVQMNHIKRYLQQGKASAMVGAGFSRNAEMDATVEMKDWNTLAKDFYERLYSQKPTGDQLNFKSPLRLASQVEASFGRTELDDLIASSLPNDRISPSEIHEQLMALPWSDVFTTNYDTLLEDASKKSKRNYYLVTNKSTLIYKTRPRIIKLHGSFPDVRPFIITEEDFIRYKKNYPEFVNTVRQALIETLFCLIGFSGDDPNFLNWLDWVRDIMGPLMTHVYQITYSKTVNYTDLRLLEKRGIIPVNLALITDDCQPISITEAFEFLFKYLSEKDVDVDLSISYDKLVGRSAEELIDKDFIEKMSSLRKSYPGWYLLPSSYYRYFRDDAGDGAFLENSYKKLEDNLKLPFLYELNWRYNIALIPIHSTWMVDAIQECVSKEYEERECEYQVAELMCSLLNAYRVACNEEKFNHIVGLMDERWDRLDVHQKNVWFYEQCLYHINDSNKISDLLSKWNPGIVNYEGRLWKAYIQECSGNDVEIKSLEESLQKLQDNMLATEGNSAYLESMFSLYERTVMIYKREYRQAEVVNRKYSFDEIFNHLVSSLQSQQEKDASGYSHIFNFNLHSASNNWNSSDHGFFKDYLFSYRCLALHERAGSAYYCDQNILPLILRTQAKYNFLFTFEFIERLNREQVLKRVISRGFLLEASKKDIEIASSRMFCRLESTTRKKGRYNSTNNNIALVLSRLITRLGDNEVKRFFDLLLNKDSAGEICLEQQYFDSIYATASSDLLVTHILLTLMKAGEKPRTLRSEINLPCLSVREEALISTIEITSDIVKNIEKGLESENTDNQESAYTTWLRARKMKMSEDIKLHLDSDIVKWRSREPWKFAYAYAFNALPHCAEDKFNPNEKAKDYVERFVNGDYKYNNSSSQISIFSDNLNNLNCLRSRLSKTQKQAILQTICKFIEDNEEIIKKDDRAEFFGGIRQFVLTSYREITLFAVGINPNGGWDSDTLRRLLSYAIEHYSYGLPTLRMQSHIARALGGKDWEDFGERFCKMIANREIESGMGDALSAAYILVKYGGNYDNMYRVVVDEIRRNEKIEVENYIQLVQNLVEDSLIKKDKVEPAVSALEALYKNLPSYSLKEEEKANIRHTALGLVRVIEDKYNSLRTMAGISLWKVFAEDEENYFTDVRMGYFR